MITIQKSCSLSYKCMRVFKVVWSEDFKNSSDDGIVQWGSDLARSLCRNYWVEAGEEADRASSSKAEDQDDQGGEGHHLQPLPTPRYFVNIGLGFEGVVESWQTSGVAIHPDCYFRPEQEFLDGVSDDGDEGTSKNYADCFEHLVILLERISSKYPCSVSLMAYTPELFLAGWSTK